MSRDISAVRIDYPNYGKPWYMRDNLQLETCFDKKMPLVEMCDTLGRNPSSLVRHMTTMGLLRKGSNGELLRYDDKRMEWRLWATVREDKIITDNFALRPGALPSVEDKLRAAFERKFMLENPQSSVKRAPNDPAKYLYAHTESLWRLTRGVYLEMVA
ncbi:hypothetical protein [Pantoea eucrina]|uniref:hypothetical protein n=1 Tax=Pantoea eucrina TaxID=472693 RepID=UPI00080F51F9|nr:hypothetical protein [Pantoea eucrina]